MTHDTPEDVRPVLVGVGIGPGDPELVTVKALGWLRRADVVVVPDTGARAPGRAETVVAEACPEAAGRIVRVPFDMSERRGVGPLRRQAWQTSAETVQAAFEAGSQVVAFATIGDPSVYSTFAYLSQEVRRRADVRVEVVPGITAMQALAAASQAPLVEGRETLALVPATAGLDQVEAVLATCDSVMVYKAGQPLNELTGLLERLGRADQAILGVDLGLPGQWTGRLCERPDGAPAYFSTVFVPPRRATTGQSL